MGNSDRVSLENKKLTFQVKGLKNSFCEEAKTLYVREMNGQTAKDSTYHYLLSKGLNEEEAYLFIQNLHQVLLQNFRMLLKELDQLS